LPPANAPAPARTKQPEPAIHRQVSNRDERPDDPDERPADTLRTPDSPADADAGSEDDRPARRHRGRRGGRRHREAREDSGSESARRPRGAGRGEKRPRKARRPRAEESPGEDTPDREVDLEVAQDDHDLEPQAPPHDLGEADDEEIEKISDWNIPSWAEIVNGLYRP